MTMLEEVTHRAPGTAGAPAGTVARRLSRGWATTPGRLRAARAALVVVCLAAGAVGVFTAGTRLEAGREIHRRTGPLSAHAIDVYRSLAAADATLAGEFLLPAGADHDEYDSHIHEAAEGLSSAGRLVGDEALTASRIASITSQLPVYTELVGRARALVGTPAGLDHLGQASSLMQSTILRRAEALQRSESRNLDSQYERARSTPAAALTGGVAALVALAAVQFLLFRRTHRVLNVGLAASSVLVVGGLAWSTLAMSVSHDHLASSRRHSRAVTDALGLSGIAALQARANEVLALADADGAEAYDTNFAAKFQLLARDEGQGGALGAARRLATPASREHVGNAVQATRSWAAAHAQLDVLREAGRRPQAVASAIDGDAATAFSRLDEVLDRAVRAEDEAFSREIRLAGSALGGLALGTGVLALGAVACAAWGIGRRLEEYR